MNRHNPDDPLSNKPVLDRIKIPLIFEISTVIFTATLLIISSYNHISVSPYQEIIDDFIANWQTKPLVDIKTSFTECPQGYEKLIARTWPGTVIGCDCTHAWSNSYSSLEKGNCASNQTSRGCSSESSRDFYPLAKYYSYTICGLREGDSFEEAVRPSKISEDNGIECPLGYKICGSGDIDNAYCTQINLRCPINDFYITNSTFPVLRGYDSASLDSGQRIAFGRNENNLPILRLKLTEGEVCANANEYMTSSGRKLYKLLNRNKYGSCNTKVGNYTHDPRYTKIGAISEHKLFSDNGVLAEIETLSSYPIDDTYKYTWNLYSGSSFSWSTKCENENKINRRDLVLLITGCAKTSKYQLAIENHCFYLLMLSIFTILTEIGIVFIKSKNARDVFHMFSGLLFLITIALILAFLAKSIFKITTCDNKLELITKSNCSSDFANQMLKDYTNSRASLKELNWIMLSFSAVLFIIRVVILVIELKVKRDYNRL